MGCECKSLGGTQFQGFAGGSIANRGSTNNQGRHGASNLWAKWPSAGSKKLGISARAPYNLGNVKTPNTLAGSTSHATGLNLGPHGHGVGAVPSAIGGPHNPRSGTAQVTGQSGRKGLTPNTFCFRCFGTWIAAGVAVFFILALSGGR